MLFLILSLFLSTAQATTYLDNVVVENSITVPTASQGDNSTKAASTAYTDTAVSAATIPDATTVVKGKIQLAGDLSGTAASPTVPALASKEPTITAGTSAQYWRGDKTFQTLNTLAVPELTNLYWTQARFNTAFGLKTTTDLTEGANLYFTDARAQNAVFSRLNYITNPSAEVDASDWNIYNDTGRTVPASAVNQDLTWTSALSGGLGNGAIVQYLFTSTPGCTSTTPCVATPTASKITVSWYNGPTLANNPTATVLCAAVQAVPAAVAIANCTITGTGSDRQYISPAAGVTLANGGDTAPVDGSGGMSTGLTFTRTTSAPLVETASFLLSKDASDQLGSGVSTDFAINSADKGNTLQLSFYYSGTTNFAFGSASDVKVFLYDKTNAVFIPLTRSTITGPTAGTVYRFAAQFDASSTSVDYRVILHNTTQNALAWDLKLDQVTVNATLDASAATEVPKIVLPTQPITGLVTDHMAVMWQDGNTAWRPATMAAGADSSTLFGFATNIVGLTADVTIRGALDGFSFGPFLGYNQYVDTVAGGISPSPASFTDAYVVMGKGIADDTIMVEPKVYNRLVTSKGGLLTNGGLNNGTGDVVVAAGTTGQFLRYNTGLTNGFSAFTPVATAPIVYTASTSTWSCVVATGSVAGCLAAADFTTFNAKAPTASPTFTGVPAAPTAAAATNTTQIATTAFVTTADNLKANLASPTFTGTPTLPTGTIAVTQAALNSTTAVATTAFVTTADNLKANLAAPTFTGDVNSSTGNVLISTLGKGLQVKTGTNSKIGTAVLVGGTVTVANTSVTANSRIFVTSNTDGGTPGWLRVSAKVNATSFTITSSSGTDTSTVAWHIVESIP